MTIPSDKTLRLERTKLNPQQPKGRNTTLIMAVVAGVAAAALAYVFLNKQQTTVVQAPPPPPQMQSVVVATRDIPIRQPITADMVRLASVPPSKVNPNAATTLSSVEGQVSVNPILKDAQLATTDVQPRNSDLGISMIVPKGKRAITIALDPVSSVAGFVKPGDYVDVLSTFAGRKGQSLTRVVLQNVPLLATGSQVMATNAPAPAATSTNGTPPPNAANPDGTPGPKSQDVPNATVIVTPQDAEKLIMAVSKGRLQLALRSQGDTSIDEIPTVHESAVTTVPPESTATASVRTVVKIVKVPVTPPLGLLPNTGGVTPAPVPSTITVIRGAAPQTVTVSP